jgi:hypothetical protein
MNPHRMSEMMRMKHMTGMATITPGVTAASVYASATRNTYV